MKNILLTITLVGLTALAEGCKPAADDSAKTTSEQLDKAKTDTKAAAQDMKDYTFAQKAEFTEHMKGQLDALNHDLDQLAASIEKSSDTVRAEAKPKLQALREQAAKLNQQLDDAKNATESTWGDVKDGFKKGFDALKDGFQKSRQWLSDKIAP